MTRDERQEIARVKWIKNHCKGTLVQPTGAGKTVTALKCLQSIINKYPTLRILVVVPTDNLKNQWRIQLDTWGMEFSAEVQVINSVVKNNWTVDILVLDECHRYASETFSLVFKQVKYKYILGLTATFDRLDGKQELIRKYCPVVDEIPLIEAKLNHWVADYKEYLVVLQTDDINTYKDYNKSFIASFEFFNFDWNFAMSMKGPTGYIAQNSYRDKLCPNGSREEKLSVLKTIKYHSANFMRMVQKRKAYINNHPKKIEVARRIIEARSNSKIITFSNNIKMAESIGMNGQVYTGKDSKKKARANLEEFNSAQTGLIHSCSKLNEGADIKGLNVGIILGLDSSEIKAVQRRGRCIRFEKDKVAEIFNLVIDQTVEMEWFKKGHPNHDYITIDEKGLQDVLLGKEPQPYKKKLKNFTFRF